MFYIVLASYITHTVVKDNANILLVFAHTLRLECDVITQLKTRRIFNGIQRIHCRQE